MYKALPARKTRTANPTNASENTENNNNINEDVVEDLKSLTINK